MRIKRISTTKSILFELRARRRWHKRALNENNCYGIEQQTYNMFFVNNIVLFNDYKLIMLFIRSLQRTQPKTNGSDNNRTVISNIRVNINWTNIK